jgi:FkbM family methyltransferase
MPEVIPHQFHFVFGLRKQYEPFHLAYYLCLESCRRVNQPEAMRFYYHYEPYGPYWDLIKPKLTLVKVPLVPMVQRFRYKDPGINRFRYAHHSDFIRLEKLLEGGGVYADIDTLFVRPLPPSLFQKPFVLGRERDIQDPNTGRPTSSLCNALIMSSPGADFGRLWLEGMTTEFDGTWSNHSTLFPQRLATQFPTLIHVEPQRSFYHFPPTRRGLAALLEDCQSIPDGAYSMHLWAHLWWEQRRVDFTSFHAGLLTEDFIRQVDTTYNCAARPFLPPASGTSHQCQSSPIRSLGRRAEALARTTRAEARALAGLTVYPALQKVWPGAQARLGLARGHWAYKSALRRFKARNAFEAAIVRSIIQWDEYQVFGRHFRPEDVVIDIGAHIGSFSFAYHYLGSREIHAFEADPTNFARLRNHLSDLPGMHLHNCAVFRSDAPAVDDLLHSGPALLNTGGGNVIFGGQLFDPDTQESWISTETDQSRVLAVPLDEVLGRFERVKLLKLGCEGSEYPILLTSLQLPKVERIVGECQEIHESAMPLLVAEARLDGFTSYGSDGSDSLARKLEVAGFRVSIIPTDACRGRFEAVRK